MHFGLGVIYVRQLKSTLTGWSSDHTLRARTDKREKHESHPQTHSSAMLSRYTLCISTRTMNEIHLFITISLSLTNFRICFPFALIGYLSSQASYGHIEGTNFMTCFQNALLRKKCWGLCYQSFREINHQHQWIKLCTSF